MGSKTKQGRLLKGLLFDPYKKAVSLVEVRNDLHVWHKLLACDCVDVNRVMPAHGDRECVDLWFDDEFLMKDPVGPGFAFIDPLGTRRVYHGYGLFLSSDNEGNSTDMTLFADMPDGIHSSAARILIAALEEALQLRWENWEHRLPQDAFLAQQMRVPELELESDDFRSLAVID